MCVLWADAIFLYQSCDGLESQAVVHGNVLLWRRFLVLCSSRHFWIVCNCCWSSMNSMFTWCKTQIHWIHPQCFNQQQQPETRVDRVLDPYILDDDVALYYSWYVKGKFVFSFFFLEFAGNTCTGIQTFRSLPDSQSLCFTARCPKQLRPANRLAPAGRRNKLLWMEESFLEESPLSCLRPETRHFPSEVQETILDRSHKSYLPHASTQHHANGQRNYCLIGYQLIG